MHYIQIDGGEFELLKQAKRKRDWTILPTWKLKYLYQRFIALSADDMVSIKEIAQKAKIHREIRTFGRSEGDSCEIKENMIKYKEGKELPF